VLPLRKVTVFLNLTTQVWISISPNASVFRSMRAASVCMVQTSLFSANSSVPPATCKPLKIETGQLLPALFVPNSVKLSFAVSISCSSISLPCGSNGLRNSSSSHALLSTPSQAKNL